MKEWNRADSEGIIHVPDELDKLVNGIGTQIRLHKLSGKNEIQTVVDIGYSAQKFFREHPEYLTAGIAD